MTGGDHTVSCVDQYGKNARLKVPPLPYLSDFAASPSASTVTAGGSVSMTATARFIVPLDAYGHVTSSDERIDGAITYTVTGPSGVAQPCAATVCPLTEAGLNQITGSSPAAMSDQGVPVTKVVAQVQVAPGPLSGITLSPPAATIVAGGQQQYTVRAVDAFGNPLSDVTSDALVVLDSHELCTEGLCSTKKAGIFDVTAHFGPSYHYVARATLTVAPATPTGIAITPANATVAAGQAQPFTVSTVDAFGNVVADVTHTSTVTSSVGTCPDAACTITRPGVDDVGATYTLPPHSGVPALPAFAQTTLTVVPGPFTGIALSPATATVAAGEAQQYAVWQVDAFGNPVQDVTATSTVSGPFGDCPDARCATTQPGTYTVVAKYVRDTPVGVFTYTAVATLTVTAGPPAAVGEVSGSLQSTQPGTAFAAPLVATVVDAYGNPLAAVPVAFAVAAGSATFPDGASAATVTSDAAGTATSPALTAGDKAGPVLVTATSPGAEAAAAFFDVVLAPGDANADVAVALQVPATVAPGGIAKVQITVTNAGPDVAARPTIGLAVPPGLTVVGKPGAARVGDLLILRTDALAPNATVTRTVKLAAAATGTGTASLSATALSVTSVPAPDNNITSATVTIA